MFPATSKQITIKQFIFWCTLILLTVPTISRAETSIPTTIVLSKDEPLIRKFPSNSGTINFSTNLNQGEEIKIIFSEKKHMEHTTLLTLTTSDQNCKGEHETSISFREKSKYTVSKYFDARTAWGKPLTYSITWKNKKDFILTLNDNPISIQISRKPKYIHIQTTGKSISLHQFLIQ
jgi:hypothetical protein